MTYTKTRLSKPRLSDKAIATGILSPNCACCFGWIFIGVIFTFWTDSNLDFWLTHFKGQPVDAPLWISFLLSCFGPSILLLNLVAEIGKLLI